MIKTAQRNKNLIKRSPTVKKFLTRFFLRQAFEIKVSKMRACVSKLRSFVQKLSLVSFSYLDFFEVASRADFYFFAM